MDKEIIVVGLEKYRFANEDSGEIVEGAKIHFLEKSDSNDEARFGYLPRSINVKKDFELVYDLPAICKAEFDIDFSYKKPSTKLVSLKKTKPFDLEIA